MKVLLTKDVKGLGRAGDVKEVSDGHARNFLIPKHLGLPATSSILAQVQKEEQERQIKFTKEQERFKIVADKLANKTFTIKGKADKQHLFAAVKPDQIASAINEKVNANIEPKQIIISTPVKSLGEHAVEVEFANHPKVKVKLIVEAIH